MRARFRDDRHLARGPRAGTRGMGTCGVWYRSKPGRNCCRWSSGLMKVRVARGSPIGLCCRASRIARENNNNTVSYFRQPTAHISSQSARIEVSLNSNF